MIRKLSLLLTFFFSLHVCAEVSHPMKLYHGTLADNIELLEPRLRYTPGEEKDSPAGIYATDDPAFAAAHAFPWSSLEGIDLHYEGDEEFPEHHIVLEVPKSIFPRLFTPVFIYEVPCDQFELLNIPPYGHNYRSLETVRCISKMRFENIIEAIQYYGGEVIIKEDL